MNHHEGNQASSSGEGGASCFSRAFLTVSEELALVEQKVFLGRSSVVSKRWWLQGQVLPSCEVFNVFE